MSKLKMLQPGSTIGIVGGGQLGQMMALSAKYMGFRIGVLDPTPDCPAAQVGDWQIVADYDDDAAIRRLAERSDALTYEFENVDADALDTVRDITEIPQGTDLLRVTQDRIQEKTFINSHGIGTAPWRPVNSIDDLRAAVAELGLPAVLKTTRGGYDGHGQFVLRTPEDIDIVAMTRPWGPALAADSAETAANTAATQAFAPSILEGFVDFAYEASILVSGNGEQFVTFPVVRNVHRNNILHMTIAPAEHAVDPDSRLSREARDLALRLAKGFGLAGTLAIELFVLRDGGVLVNELAPRPHNSGHYTIEACSIDQFEAHIRGIAGWPLPEPRLLSPAVMVNVLGQHVAPTRALIGSHPEWFTHDYGKSEVRHDRKMGHITVLTDDTAATAAALEATGCWDDLRA